jgi:hypothetical protein
VVVLALGLGWAGCTGDIQGASTLASGGPGDRPAGEAPPGTKGPPKPGGTPVTPAPAGPGPSAACKPTGAVPSPLRRLSNAEYDNTVADLFGLPSRPAHGFIPETRVNGFDNNAEARVVSSTLAQQYFAAAEGLAQAAVASTSLATLLPCDARANEAACVDKLLDTFGRRAWRRPLEPAERESLKRAFAEGKGGGFAAGIQTVIQVMLLSPQFMYRIERGVAVPGQSYLALSPHELASRLSYLLWGSMPDEPLFAAAEGGRLATRQDVLGQARRMLDDPRAARMWRRFTDQWLRLEEIAQLEKQSAVYPTFKPELRGALLGEAQALIDDVLAKGDGKLGTLLTAPYTFMNGPLAAYYGQTGVSGEAFQKVALDPQRRAGMLTQAGLLAVLGVNDDGLTSLVHRGLFVRERLLCQPVQDPPADAQGMGAPTTAATTAREWAESRAAVPLCNSCHSQMDPIGFAFEHFDGAGLYRTTDRGRPVDARGQLKSTDIDGTFDGAGELVAKLATSAQVQECLATQIFRHGFGRQETEADTCALEALAAVARSSGGSFKDVLLALTQTDSFLLFSKGDRP